VFLDITHRPLFIQNTDLFIFQNRAVFLDKDRTTDNVQELNIGSYKIIFSTENKTVRMLQRTCKLTYLIYVSRDSEAAIATGFELDGRGVEV
jgi:hypothetical protein